MYQGRGQGGGSAVAAVAAEWRVVAGVAVEFAAGVVAGVVARIAASGQ